LKGLPFILRYRHPLLFYADVYVQFSNGEIRKVSPKEDGKYYEPCISLGGRRVAFFGSDSGPAQIWLSDLEKNTLRTLTDASYSSRHPAFSPDGKKITFASDRDSGHAPERIENQSVGGAPSASAITHIYLMNTDGSDCRRLTQGNYIDQRPVFSADGNSIIFVSNRGGKESLWRTFISEENYHAEALLPGRFAYRPHCDFSGDYIYFWTKLSAHRHQIQRLNPRTGEVSALENDNEGLSHGPFVSPLGNYVLSHSTRVTGRWKLWRVPLDGGAPYCIQPKGFRNALHPSESANGILVFDTVRKPEPLESLITLREKLSTWLGRRVCK